MYIIDSSFFIENNRLHLTFDKHPEFWSWLVHLANLKIISIPKMVYNELIEAGDKLSIWIEENKNVFVDTISASYKFNTVIEAYGFGEDVSPNRLNADPWVIAHALAVSGTVVTSEKSGKQTSPFKKKIPSICSILNVRCCTIITFLWEMRYYMPGVSH